MGEPALKQQPEERGQEPDRLILLQGATWADYQRLLEIRGDRPVPRLSYLEGTVEFMSPSQQHEAIKSMIGRLLEAWCMERGVEISAYGFWTLEDKAADRGVEPDECYVLGDNPEPQRPHLAIEVIWTLGGLNKLELYRKLGVQEVWIWQAGHLSAYGLRGDAYEPLTQSEVLAGIDLSLLARFIPSKPMTKAVREYREALRTG